MTEEKKAPRKRGCLPVLIMLVLLAGAAVGALHYFGKLQTVIDYARSAVSKVNKPAPVPPSGKGSVEPGLSTPRVTETRPTTTMKTPTAATAAVRPTAPTAVGAGAAYRAKFRPPRVGSEIVLATKDGRKLSGTLDAVDDAGVRISSKNVTLTLTKAQLAPMSVARCFVDEYVAYMLELDRLRDVELAAMDDHIAKLKAEYERQRERQAAAMEKQKANVSRARPVKGAADDGDFKKWMETQGESDLLKARKQRIAEYEAQRIAEGREY